MIRTWLKKLVFGVLLLSATAAALAMSADSVNEPVPEAQSQSISPINSGGTVNVIYVTGGPYSRYFDILRATLEGLEEVGVLSEGSASGVVASDQQELWGSVSAGTAGERLNLLADGFYSYEWNDRTREQVREQVLRRLAEKRDVDMILTIGTDATHDMARAVKDIPVISIGSSDPVANGLVRSTEDSGQDNFHALITENLFDWQVSRFHSIFGFRRLGLLSVRGAEAKSGVRETEKICNRLGVDFALATYEISRTNRLQDYENLRAALQSLIDQDVDAVYLPYFDCPDEKFSDFLRMMTSRGIPCFSQVGHDPVSRGVLLSVNDTDMKAYGSFEANVIAQVIDGVKPRDIPQLFSQNPGLVINLKTAMQMGWQIPFGLLLSVDKTYRTHSPQLR